MYAKLPFDHKPDQAKIPKAWRTPRRYDVIILSDYRYSSFTRCAREWLIREVHEQGAGLLMIGGWASFTGLVGGYAKTDLETLLPVLCVPKDDRVNCASGAVVGPVDSKSPVICGYHRATVKPGSQTRLELRELSFKHKTPQLGKPYPLLVTGQAGLGKTAAFLTDCAPHWAGGLVDWGTRRQTISVAPGVDVEVGDCYLKWFASLIRSLKSVIRD